MFYKKGISGQETTYRSSQTRVGKSQRSMKFLRISCFIVFSVDLPFKLWRTNQNIQYYKFNDLLPQFFGTETVYVDIHLTDLSWLLISFQ